MRTPTNLPANTGLVAILDALGAAHYDHEGIKQFLEARAVVMRLLNDKAESEAEKLDVGTVSTFTFNDTMLIVLKSKDAEVLSDEMRAFFTIMRKLLLDSLVHGILFRGAIGIGSFYVDEASNTILGQAVTDSAAWYDKTEWMGVVATPRASMMIQRAIEKHRKDWELYLLDYEVPLKGGATMSLKAVNWPKTFLAPSLTPCAQGEEKRVRLLELLSSHSIPWGTERKYTNTIAFFDYSIARARARARESARSGARFRLRASAKANRK